MSDSSDRSNNNKNNGKQEAGESFVSLMSSTKRLQTDKVSPYRKRIKPVATQRQADEARVMEELLSSDDESSSFYSGDELTFLRESYPRNILKKLRRGEYAIQEELDLHGLFAEEAKVQVHGFINECARYNISAVRIIHGKGLHSPDKKPVLKNLILGWLKKNQFIIAVSSTPSNDGGTGAIYALINSK